MGKRKPDAPNSRRRNRTHKPLVYMPLDLPAMFSCPMITVKQEAPDYPSTDAPEPHQIPANPAPPTHQLPEDKEAAYKETIKSLELRLTEALEAQAAAKTLSSLEHLKLQRRIEELDAHNKNLQQQLNEGNQPIPRPRRAQSTQTHQSTDSKESKQTAEPPLHSTPAKTRGKLEEKLSPNIPSTENTDPNNPIAKSNNGINTTELIALKMKLRQVEQERLTLWIENQDLVPLASRAEDLEVELQLADKIIDNLRKAMIEHGVGNGSSAQGRKTSVKQSSNGTGGSSRGLEVPEDVEGSSGVVEKPEDLESSDEEDIPWCSDPLESPDGGPSDVQGKKDRRIWVGKLHVFASNPKFFDIQWKKHYHRRGKRGTYTCKDCGHLATVRTHIEDHVWLKHYEERYQCPLCMASISWRYDIKRHMKLFHGDEK